MGLTQPLLLYDKFGIAVKCDITVGFAKHLGVAVGFDLQIAADADLATVGFASNAAIKRGIGGGP